MYNPQDVFCVQNIAALKHQRDLLDLEIKKLEIKERIDAAFTFTINMHTLNARTSIFYIDGKRVEKLKACLLELLWVD